MAGYDIGRLSSAATAGLSACFALALLPFLVSLTGTESAPGSIREALTSISASREAFRYFLNEPQGLSPRSRWDWPVR